MMQTHYITKNEAQLILLMRTKNTCPYFDITISGGQPVECKVPQPFWHPVFVTEEVTFTKLDGSLFEYIKQNGFGHMFISVVNGEFAGFADEAERKGYKTYRLADEDPRHELDMYLQKPSKIRYNVREINSTAGKPVRNVSKDQPTIIR